MSCPECRSLAVTTIFTDSHLGTWGYEDGLECICHSCNYKFFVGEAWLDQDDPFGENG